MTARSHRFTTPASLWEHLDNDYENIEQVFAGRGGILFDLGENSLEKFPELERTRRRIDRDALFLQFVRQEERVPKLAVVINVAKRPRVFPDVLISLARQSFLKTRPQSVEVLLVQDGPVGVLDDEVRPELLRALSEFADETRLQGFRLRASRGRSTARNVGIFYASPDTQVVMFLDDAMILHEDFVAEHMLRHALVGPPIALLGFKANREFKNFDEYVRQRDQKLWGRPPFEEDWKWSKKLKKDEVTFDGGNEGFEYHGKTYQEDSIVSYMEVSNNLKDLRGAELIGHRGLPMFFHTGLTSVNYDSVCAVGGFEQMFDVDVWGFEDSYLGLLLAAKEVKIVPCPSSVAYKIELNDEEGMDDKGEQLDYHRKTFWDCAKHREWNFYNKSKLKGKIEDLMVQELVERVHLNSAGRQGEPTQGTQSPAVVGLCLKGNTAPTPSVMSTPATALVRRLDISSALTERDAAVVDDHSESGVRSLELLYVEREVENKILDHILKSSGEAVLIDGEPGSGKTSLLWNLCKRVRKEQATSARPWFVKATTLLEFAPEEIGEAMQLVRRTGRSPVLLVDTVDLILHDPVKRAHFLKTSEVAAESGGTVVVTCRPREANKYLASLAVSKFRLNDYNETEFKLAIKLHVDHYCPRSDVISQLDYQTRLNDAVIRGKPVREVCLRPLTLRMLFAIYGPGGDVPTDINGAHLYDQFWEWRVRSDRRHGEPHEQMAADMSFTAKILAAEMLADGNLEIHRSHALALMSGRSSDENRKLAEGIDTLVARGVLRAYEGRLEFFHQTFFEHAAARCVLELLGSDGLSALAVRCHTRPDDLFRMPVLEQALILSNHYSADCRESAEAIVDRLFSSAHTAHLVTAAYVYAQMAVVAIKTRQAAEKAMLAHEDVAIRFIASIPSIPPARVADIFRELDFIWNNVVAPKLESVGKWGGGLALLEQLPRLAIRGGEDAERVLAFLRKHEVVQAVLRDKAAVYRLLAVIAALAPYSPDTCWTSFIRLYLGAPGDPTSAAVRARVAETVATQAPSMPSTQIATDFERAVEPEGPSEGLYLESNRAWGSLWAKQWNAAETDLGAILSQISTQENQVRLARQLYGLAQIIRGQLPERVSGNMESVWTCFLAEENKPHRTKWIKFWKELIESVSLERGQPTFDRCEEFLVNKIATYFLGSEAQDRAIAAQFVKQLLQPSFSESVTKRLMTDLPSGTPRRWLVQADLGLLLPIAYVLGHLEAESVLTEVADAPVGIKKGMLDYLLGDFAARAELGSEAALVILFRFAEKVAEAKKKILLLLENENFNLQHADLLGKIVLDRVTTLNAFSKEWLASPDVGDHRNAARLLYQMASLGVSIEFDPEEVHRRYQAEADYEVRVNLALFMGEWASSGGKLEYAISALSECAASEEAKLSSIVLAGLVKCSVNSGQLPLQALEILKIALSVRPTEERLIEAARMVRALAGSHFEIASEVLQRFSTSESVKTKSTTVTKTLRRVLYQPFKAWALHSSQSDRRRLVEKLHKFEPELACLLLTVVCEEDFDNVSESFGTIEKDERIDEKVKRYVHSLRKKHLESAQGETWAELRILLKGRTELTS